MPTANALQRTLHLVVRLPVVATLTACSAVAPEPSEPSRDSVRVEHYERNRCGEIAEQPCRSDEDCGFGACVSVLASDAGAFGRDGGHTVRVGDRVLWQFGDTFVTSGLLSSTAAWSDTVDPLTLRDARSSARSSKGQLTAFLPFVPSEIAFNEERAVVPPCCLEWEACGAAEPTYCRCEATVDCTQRIALWPGDGTETGPGTATVYYERQVVGVAPYDFTPGGVGVATVEHGAAVANRLRGEDGEYLLLFGADEPHFARGLEVVADGRRYFYLYANGDRSGCSVDVLAARVPVSSMADRSAYRFWNGSEWDVSLAAASPIVESITGGLGSVTWNGRLHRYLSVWNDICTGGSTLVLRTAPTPLGPWSDAMPLDLASLGASADAYYGLVHPEFGDGAELVVTYFEPLDLVYGQMRLLRLILP